jgi:galactitol PTS system EIIA component
MRVIVNEELMITDVVAQDKESVIIALGSRLLKNGYVKDGFIESALQREHIFPTGLPTEIPVALPHTDAEFCNQSAIAVATLRNTVPFSEMGNSDNELPIAIVFMLAIKDPKEQINWLQKLVTIFKDKNCLEDLRAAKDSRTLAESINSILNEE